MCKCNESKVKVENLPTYGTNVPAGSEESVIGIQSSFVLETPKEKIRVNAGKMYSIPKSQAIDLRDKKAPLWIVA